MTDITELAQSLKAAADREMICRDGAETSEIWERTVTPENILALVEALEKAQQVDEELCRLLPLGAEYMDPPDGGDVTPLEGVRRMVVDYRQRIAELESRTVTVKLTDINEYLAEVHDKTLNRALRLLAEGVRAGDVAAMRAAGIKVEAE
ncbi:hypothetical protein ACNGVW_000236 [Klebsiella variicola]